MAGEELTIALIDVVIKYGVPAVIKVIKDWNIDPDSITLEDIKRLHDLVPKPETYFESTE